MKNTLKTLTAAAGLLCLAQLSPAANKPEEQTALLRPNCTGDDYIRKPECRALLAQADDRCVITVHGQQQVDPRCRFGTHRQASIIDDCNATPETRRRCQRLAASREHDQEKAQERNERLNSMIAGAAGPGLSLGAAQFGSVQAGPVQVAGFIVGGEGSDQVQPQIDKDNGKVRVASADQGFITGGNLRCQTRDERGRLVCD